VSEPRITLLESPALISSGGTTGLRTWEAALHLGQFLIAQPSLIAGKRVLELGAGTGYLSILCAKHLCAAHVVATDGSADVLAGLAQSLFVNGLQDRPDAVSTMELVWGYSLPGADEAQCSGGQDMHVVLGADVTYDKAVIPALVGTLDDLLGRWPSARAIVAATERNRDTYQSFLAACRMAALEPVEVDTFPVPAREEQDGPFYADGVAVRICEVKRLW
jgi:protein-lysine N-methyltransferase EEF2KMT